jgi:3-hydroxyisobutyrate dehydrogenase-like beta-hydroxyacid dehydrogenase
MVKHGLGVMGYSMAGVAKAGHEAVVTTHLRRTAVAEQAALRPPA